MGKERATFHEALERVRVTGTRALDDLVSARKQEIYLRYIFECLADLCPTDAEASWWEFGEIRDDEHAINIAALIAKSFGVEVKA